MRVLLHSTPPSELPSDQIEVVWSDNADVESLLRATEGIDWVIATASGPAMHLVDAAKVNGVRHLVLITSRMADDRWDFMPSYPARARDERHLAESGVPFTVLRPGGIVDPDDGEPFRSMARFARDRAPVRQFGPSTLPGVYVFTDELAEFAVQAHAYPATWGQRFDIGGPSMLTRERLWALIGEVVGEAPIVTFEPVELLTRLRLEAEEAGDPSLMMRLAREEVAAQIELGAPDMARINGVFGGIKQRDLGEWLRAFL